MVLSDKGGVSLLLEFPAVLPAPALLPSPTDSGHMCMHVCSVGAGGTAPLSASSCAHLCCAITQVGWILGSLLQGQNVEGSRSCLC